MYYGVREELPYCVAGKAVILLDVKTNRYLGLPLSSAAAFSRLIDNDGELDENDQRRLAGLLARGYLTTIPAPKKMPRHANIEPPATDYVEALLGSAPLRYVIRAALAQVSMAVRLRAFSFSQILTRLQSTPLSNMAKTADHDLQLSYIAFGFDRAGYVFGSADQCLARSLAMFSLCRGFGISTNLVVAVRSDPFAAHSWVQCGTTVLNDSIENVRNFTPILVAK